MRRYKREYRRTFKSKADFAKDMSNAKPNWKWKKKKKAQSPTPPKKRHMGGHNTGYLYDLLKHLIIDKDEGE